MHRMDQELSDVKRKIEKLEAELELLPAGHPEQTGIQLRLGALEQQKAVLMQQVEGAYRAGCQP